MAYACQLYSVKCVSKIKSILSIIYIQYMELCILIFLVIILRICILSHIIIITKSEVWTISLLGLGQETMLWALCLAIILLISTNHKKAQQSMNHACIYCHILGQLFNMRFCLNLQQSVLNSEAIRISFVSYCMWRSILSYGDIVLWYAPR